LDKEAAMRNLSSPTAIKIKGLLFLVAGVTSAVLLIIEQPTFKIILLLAITVWCFCRAYYFAFYVIEHYVDPAYHFSGLWSFGRYLMKRRSREKRRKPGDGAG
jgi:hypothetical protein